MFLGQLYTDGDTCIRKAIYELLVYEDISGKHYDQRIKALKEKHSDIDDILIDTLSTIKDMTNDKVHEQSWDKWNASTLKLLIVTLKETLNQIYVIPKKRQERIYAIQQLRHELKSDKSERAKS